MLTEGRSAEERRRGAIIVLVTVAVYEEPEEHGYIVPFSTPFIAGPGAITTVITLSARGDDVASIDTVLIAITIPLIALAIGLFKLGDLDISP